MMEIKEKEVEEWDNTSEDRQLVQQEGGYGAINQTDTDNYNVSYSLQIPTEKDFSSRQLSQEKGRTNILINLCIFGSITLIFTIIFMFTLSKKEIHTESSVVEVINQIGLLHTLEKGIHCPDAYSFSPVQLQCIKCPLSCLICQPGIGGQNPCIKCSKPFSLMGEQCFKSCPHGYHNFEGICLLDVERRFQKGSLSLNDTVSSNIEYMIYIPKTQVTKVIFMLPPIGSNQIYFSVMADLSKFADTTNAALISVATPVEQVAKFIPQNSDDILPNQEEFVFVKLLANQLLTLIDRDDVVEYYYVGLSDSLFIVHRLSQYMIKNNICKQCQHTLVLLQTQITRLAITLKLDQLELGIVLGYLDNQFDIKHSDQGNVTHSGNVIDKPVDEEENKVVKTLRAAQEFKNRYDLAALNKLAYNVDLQIILLNESGFNAKAIIADLKRNRPKMVEVVEVDLKDLYQEQQVNNSSQWKKIEYLVGESLLDLILQHSSWVVREKTFNQIL